MPHIFLGELDGLGAYVHAADREIWDGALEEGVEEEGYAACACAEVQDAQGRGYASVVVSAHQRGFLQDEVGEVDGVGFRLRPGSNVLETQHLLFHRRRHTLPLLSLIRTWESARQAGISSPGCQKVESPRRTGEARPSHDADIAY